MAVSLAFHIIFAEVGIAMPLMMTIAEWRWLRTGDAVYLDLAKRWAKGTASLACGPAYRMSHDSASAAPAPTAAPLTAAMEGTSSDRSDSQVR